MIPVSSQTLLLALHALAEKRRSVHRQLDAGELNGDELDELNDKSDQLTRALGELGDLYEPQREGMEEVLPSFEKILSRYE